MKRIVMALALPAILQAQQPDTAKHANHVERGAKVGAAIGTIGLGLIGAMLSGLCERDCGGAAAQGLVLGAGSGVLIGAATGAVVGSLFQNWNEAPRQAFPVTADLSVGYKTAQGGLQYSRGDTRFGFEGMSVDLDDRFGRAFVGDPGDPHMLSTARTLSSRKHFGIDAEHKLVGPLWASASAVRYSATDVTTTSDWRGIIASGLSQPLVTTTAHTGTGLGGSVGVVARHRVAGEVYVRVDARQYFGPQGMRTLTAGVEF